MIDPKLVDALVSGKARLEPVTAGRAHAARARGAGRDRPGQEQRGDRRLARAHQARGREAHVQEAAGGVLELRVCLPRAPAHVVGELLGEARGLLGERRPDGRALPRPPSTRSHSAGLSVHAGRASGRRRGRPRRRRGRLFDQLGRGRARARGSRRAAASARWACSPSTACWTVRSAQWLAITRSVASSATEEARMPSSTVSVAQRATSLAAARDRRARRVRPPHPVRTITRTLGGPS